MNKKRMLKSVIGIFTCSLFICYGMDLPKDKISSHVFDSLLDTSIDLPLALNAVPSCMISNENRIVIGASEGLYVIRFKNFLEGKSTALQVNSIDIENASVQKIMPIASSDECFVFIRKKGIRFLNAQDKLNTEFQGLFLTSLSAQSQFFDSSYIQNCWCNPQGNYLIVSYVRNNEFQDIFGLNLNNHDLRFIMTIPSQVISGAGFLNKETFLLEYEDGLGGKKGCYIKVPDNNIQTRNPYANWEHSVIYPECGALIGERDRTTKKFLLSFCETINACSTLQNPFAKKDNFVLSFPVETIRSGIVRNNIISFAIVTELSRRDHWTELAVVLNCNNKEIKVFEDARRTSNIAGNMFVFVDKKGKVFFKEINWG